MIAEWTDVAALEDAGEEVTQEVLDNPRCIIFDEAENRLHVQKAILAALAG